MFLKICANTNLEDAALAAELGADAVGFVFAPSRRRVTVEQVAEITPHLPDTVASIGVFDHLVPDAIAEAVHRAHLSGVQLHGEYSPALVEALREAVDRDITVIQTVHWDVGAASADAVAAKLGALRADGLADLVLVDSRTASGSGGTGVAFDWNAARAALAALGDLPFLLAGGLRPDNVAEAIRVLHPWGVDVASGVEAEPGRKDPARLRAFLANARQAAASGKL